jgi:hypothetical protein
MADLDTLIAAERWGVTASGKLMKIHIIRPGGMHIGWPLCGPSSDHEILFEVVKPLRAYCCFYCLRMLRMLRKEAARV